MLEVLMAQSIKYEKTEIDPAKSVAEIGELVRKYGGSRFEQLWGEAGEVSGVRFAIRHEEIGELPISMTARTGEIERILTASGYATGRTLEQKRERPERVASQARRVAWRHLKDLTEQLLLAVELGLRSLPAAFMADIETFDESTGETVTMYEFFERHAAVSGSRRGVELTAARPASEAIELPAAEGEW